MKQLIWLLLLFGVAQAQTPQVQQYRSHSTFVDPYETLEPKDVQFPTRVVAPAEPKIVVDEPQFVKEYFEKFKQNRPVSGNQPGFRIQIYSGRNSQEVRQTQFTFMSKYENIDVYQLYEQPLFKVRVGNFRTFGEADQFLKELKVQFPSAFIVPETVYIKE